MNSKKIFFLVLIFLSGIIFFGFYNEIIILRLPYKTNIFSVENSGQNRVAKIYWLNNKSENIGSNNIENIFQEEIEIIHSNNLKETIKNLLIAWLSVMQDNKFISKNINIQDISLDINNKYAYISFDKNIFEKNWSIKQKILFINSIIKTLNENHINISGLYFLINHKILYDFHLDFSRPYNLNF